jgi:phenylacetate-coenzyme A ligase PaaK-like adenylate-forming protein
LFAGKNPYIDRDGAYISQLRENVSYHVQHCEPYAGLLHARGFHPEQLQSPDDVSRLPPLTTLYLKRNRLLSVPESKLFLRATSSGTSGNKSQIGFDLPSFLLGIAMAARLFAYHHVISLRPVHYIMLGYEPSRQSDLGAMKSAYGSTFFAPALSRTYALKATKSGYQPNPEGVKSALLKFAKAGVPVRLVGFPGYLMLLLRELEKDGVCLNLNKHSRIMLGGGWKQFTGEAVTPEQMYQLVEKLLGIPKERIHEFFSAAEHPLAYCKCKNGHFHVPAYSRVIIRDPVTMSPLPYGQPGLLNFISPLVRSMPLVSVMTDDVAVLHAGESCGCGIQTPYFQLLGRAGAQGIQTCSATAAELAKGSERA